MTSFHDVYELFESAFTEEDWWGFGIGIALLLLWGSVPVYCLRQALRMARTVLLMRCLPTSKARGVFIGLTEMKGSAQRQPAIRSYLAESECVWYSYYIEEHWRKVEVRTYTDGEGRVRTRTVVRSGWETVAQGESGADFHLQDDTGSIRVWPAGANVECASFLSRTCRPRDAMYYGKGPAHSIPHSTFKRRFVERGIPIGAELYVIGTTREQEDCIHPEFAHSDNGDPFLISMRKEEAITRCKSIGAKLLPLVGVVILMAPSLIEPYPFPYNLYNPDFPFWEQSIWFNCTLVFIAVWLGWTFWQWYCGMVAARNRVLQGASQVDVQLQRRHDLIRQLVDVVEAYCRHEQSLLDRIAELRQHARQGQTAILAEKYPGLKANTLFAKLRQEISDTENRLALAREYLNTIANFYNTCLKTFPGGPLLRLLRFKKFHYEE